MGLFGIATNSVQMLVLVAVLTVAVFAVLYFEKFRYEVEGIWIYRKESKKSWTNLLLVLAAALLVKLIFAAAYEGHGTDMTCFSAWSDMIFKDGFWNFYHSDSFTDYPPGYMAMLWGIGALRSIFNLDVATGAGRCVIKLIPILFGITLLTFVLMHTSSVDAVDMMEQNTGMAWTEEQKAAAREELGLDKSVPVQYLNWVGNMLKGDMGTSYISGQPVLQMFFRGAF